MDGMSLLRVLEKPDAIAQRSLFWRQKFRDQKAARAGSWKWLSIEGNEFLFDLAKDQRERANLAKREPGKMAELKKKFAAWEASIPPLPPDAYVSFIGGPADMAHPS
jgi:hypothetical protein